MPKTLNLLNTIKGSLIEGFYPRGWDLARIDNCCTLGPKGICKAAKHWSDEFKPVIAKDAEETGRRMGEAIARQIIETRKQGRKLAIILPVGPMEMYKTVVQRLKESKTKCDHVTTFNMDEWADRHGNTMPSNVLGGFENAMDAAFFGPLRKLAIPKSQRNFAIRTNLPIYGAKIAALRKDGAKLVTVYGVGRTCHIAFWEPHLVEEFPKLSDWKKQTHKVGVALHPLTIEQNCIHSFNSRFTAVPAWANTIGPGLFLQSDYCIGGADGAFPQYNAQWQGMSICVTLQYGPSPWLPSTFMPTMPGTFIFTRPLAGPLLPAY